MVKRMKNLIIIGVIVIIALILLGIAFIGQKSGEVSHSSNNWNGTWKSELYTLSIKQSGSVISGNYEPDNISSSDPGVLAGTLSAEGKAFSGVWTESGPLNLVMSEDGMSYSGIGAVRPEGGRNPSETYKTGGKRVGNVSGPHNTWSGNWNSTRTNQTFTQNGTVVTGSYQPWSNINDEPGTFEGTVSEDGKTVSGKWTESGNFNFVLSEDGSVFNGTYSIFLQKTDDSDSWNATRLH